MGDMVLARSEVVEGITKKFVRPYDGPWKVTLLINISMYVVADKKGKITTLLTRKR
jgi:hypothetical protein